MAVPGTCFRASIRASRVQTAIQIRVGHHAILQAVNCFKDLVPSSRYAQDSRGSKQLLKALARFQDGEWYALHAFLGVLELLEISYDPMEWKSVEASTNARLAPASCAPQTCAQLVSAASPSAQVVALAKYDNYSKEPEIEFRIDPCKCAYVSCH